MNGASQGTIIRVTIAGIQINENFNLQTAFCFLPSQHHDGKNIDP